MCVAGRVVGVGRRLRGSDTHGMDCVILTTALSHLLTACRDKLSANHSPQGSVKMTINLKALAATQCVCIYIYIYYDLFVGDGRTTEATEQRV